MDLRDRSIARSMDPSLAQPSIDCASDGSSVQNKALLDHGIIKLYSHPIE